MGFTWNLRKQQSETADVSQTNEREEPTGVLSRYRNRQAKTEQHQLLYGEQG